MTARWFGLSMTPARFQLQNYTEPNDSGYKNDYDNHL
jgi:hypothetical protein